ncbi:MAG: protein-L-isoaspartate(D-aspartate) O-methyltransferase [Bacteroidetes bacterium]|nr:protein-L-isoaspartate(D-aspartate) O-methyltransferase [Bacteroidota bacterium]
MILDLFTLHRKELTENLRKLGIKDINVLDAISKVKRENFVKEEFRKYSYDNIALPLNSNQTISQPYTVAFMTELLEVKPGDKVLEIGTGSGYQSAVLAQMGAEVYSVERIKDLYLSSLEKLRQSGYSVRLKNDDGTMGWEENSPFDKIIVTAGSPRLPRHLLTQLKTGGRMVIPVGDETVQKLMLIKKSMNEEKNEAVYKAKEFENFKFVPLIGEEGWQII